MPSFQEGLCRPLSALVGNVRESAGSAVSPRGLQSVPLEYVLGVVGRQTHGPALAALVPPFSARMPVRDQPTSLSNSSAFFAATDTRALPSRPHAAVICRPSGALCCGQRHRDCRQSEGGPRSVGRGISGGFQAFWRWSPRRASGWWDTPRGDLRHGGAHAGDVLKGAFDIRFPESPDLRRTSAASRVPMRSPNSR